MLRYTLFYDSQIFLENIFILLTISLDKVIILYYIRCEIKKDLGNGNN